MAAPVIPISELGYLLKQDSGMDLAEADRPLSAHLMRHEIAATLGHVWDSGAQHKAYACPDASATALHTFNGNNVSNKSGNDAYTWFRTVVFPVRLCPDGRPEPIRVMVAGERSGSNIWIRGVYRWAWSEPVTPWPLSGDLRDGWNVGQATFSSTTQSWKELDSVVDANEQYGILQFPPGLARVTGWQTFETGSGSASNERDWEPASVALAAVDFYGGFTSGTTGTGEFWGYYIRGCAYGLLDIDT